MAVKTSSSIIEVEFNGNSYVSFERVEIPTDIANKEIISALSYTSSTFNKLNPPTLLIGYRSGLIAVYSQKRMINLLNFNKTGMEALHKQPVIQFVVTGNQQEFFAVFNDSSMLKFNYKSESSSLLFIENLKKFVSKISFSKQHNKVNFKKRTDNDMAAGYIACETSPELSFFYASNHDTSGGNPLCYYKFNCRTISDVVIISHPRFRKSFLKNTTGSQNTILAYVNYDGYLCVYDYEKMGPQFSLKSFFGGYSTITFSPNCEFLALSGHDDCLTILQVDSLAVVRCIGHRSFVSRGVFQTIPYQEGKSSNKELVATFESNKYMRLVTGSMDNQLFAYDINKENFQPQYYLIEERKGVTHLNLSKCMEPFDIKATAMFKFDNAIGWLDLVENMLITCCMDGAIITMEILTLKEEPGGKNALEKSPDDPQSSNIDAVERTAKEATMFQSTMSTPIETKSSLMQRSYNSSHNPAERHIQRNPA